MSTSTEERYARAIRTSHLEVEDAPGDVDQIIAAGLAEPLGVLLSRLRSEWDAAAGELGLYLRAQAKWTRMSNDAASRSREHAKAAESAKAQLKKAKPEDIYCLVNLGLEQETLAKRAQAESERLRDEGAREAVTGRAMILIGLRSLAPAKQALFGFACAKAKDKACSAEPKAMAALVGRVIDVWLDRLCHHCEGRGFNGGRGTPRVECRHCCGTGSRRQGQFSAVAAEHHFGLWLLGVMDSKCSASMGQMARKTRQG